jgi:uncharacterized protein YbaR (Trm112 family)
LQEQAKSRILMSDVSSLTGPLDFPMPDKRLLPNLVCPTDHTPLRVADDRMVARLNRAIAAGRVRNRAGQPVEQPIGGGLLRSDETLLYPILDGIPVLLPDEAIPLSQI